MAQEPGREAQGDAHERRPAALAAAIARKPERFVSLLSAPPPGVSVTWQHLRLDDTDRSDAVEVSWAARPPWWAAPAVGAGVLV